MPPQNHGHHGDDHPRAHVGLAPAGFAVGLYEVFLVSPDADTFLGLALEIADADGVGRLAHAADPHHTSPGRITYLHMPGGPGIRVDSHVYAGYVVPPYYDSMIGKIIARGLDRPEAVRRMQMALRECIVEGVETTLPILIRILDDADFQAGRVDTGYLAR